MNVQNVLPRDAIPSVDEPVFGPDYFGDPDDEVIIVKPENGPTRAYPIRMLSYHEIVNDEIDGHPIAVTLCPICWSAVVYDRNVDGQTLTFGVSGKLADDALVMYDRETGSEWKQPTGECIAGDHEGRHLHALAGPMVSYERFREENPDGVVLQPVRGTEPGESPAAAYDMTPYERYAQGDAFGLYGMRGEGPRRSWDRTDLEAKTVVLGIEVGNEATGYPVPTVEAAGGVITDTVGGRSLVVIHDGDGIHAFEDPGFEFEFRDSVLYADGTTWEPSTGQSADGRQLDRIPGRRLFAFAWQDAHGSAAFYTG